MKETMKLNKTKHMKNPLLTSDLKEEIIQTIGEALVDGEEKKEIKCPMGGDENDDCWGCVYGGDYHYKDGECVKRPDSIIL